MPVNSIVAIPQSGTTVTLHEDGTILVKGYALPSGDDGPIVRVEVSTDDGENWQDAELITCEDYERGVSLKWAWTLWQTKVKVEKGPRKKILSRATDKGGNAQCRCPKWNLRGVAYNGYGQAKDINVA